MIAILKAKKDINTSYFIATYFIECAVSVYDAASSIAIGNDYDYKHIYSRQVQSLSSIGGVFIGLKNLGNSINIIRGMMEANARGLKAIGVTGLNNNLNQFWDLTIKALSIPAPKIQWGHIDIARTICGLVGFSIFSEPHFA